MYAPPPFSSFTGKAHKLPELVVDCVCVVSPLPRRLPSPHAHCFLKSIIQGMRSPEIVYETWLSVAVERIELLLCGVDAEG